MKEFSWQNRKKWIGFVLGAILILGLLLNRSVGIYLPLRIPAFWILILLLSGIGLTFLAGVLEIPSLIIPAVILGSIGSFILYLGLSRLLWRLTLLVLAGAGISGMGWMLWNNLRSRGSKHQRQTLPLLLTAFSQIGILALLTGFGRSWIVLLPFLLLFTGFLIFLLIKKRTISDQKRSHHVRE